MATALAAATTPATAPAPAAATEHRFVMPAAVVTAVMTALQTMVVASFGYTLKDRIELSLKERQVTVANVKDMATLVDSMYAEGANSESRDRSVTHLAMYGRDAINPLLIMAASQNPFPAATPLKGLSFVALQHKKDVCEATAKVLASPELVFKLSLAAVKEFQASLACGSAGSA
jgi:hypothetical protein